MSEKHTFDYDLIVIGSGASGSAAAMVAADAGKSVAIVEANLFGGDSPNYGDIPTKALLHAANLYDEARHGGKFGLRSGTLGYNYPAMAAWKDLAIKHTGVNGNRRYYENKGISTFSGLAHFLSPNEISVNRRHLSAQHFLIATGSYYETPSIAGLDRVNFFTPHSILDIPKPPHSLLIIGGYEIGVEIAQIMAALGTKITIIETGDRLLQNYDREVGDTFERILRDDKGATIYVKSSPVLVEKDGVRKRITFQRGKTDRHVVVDEILITTNRFATTDIGLENANINYNQSGIQVNRHLQTSNRFVYAAGDVLGRYYTTQSAFLEGQVAAQNIISGDKITPNYKGMPEVVFVNPNIAKAGFTEDECKKTSIAIKCAITPLSLASRSNTSNFHDGFVKIITDQKGVLLGATIVAPHAAEMIHELSLAIYYKLTAADVAKAPHAFLSWSEAIRITANKLI